MKKVFMLMILAVLLSGCGNSLEEDLNENLGVLTDEEGANIFPDGMTDGGRDIFGDGSESDGRDIFSIIESKIWGDEDADADNE